MKKFKKPEKAKNRNIYREIVTSILTVVLTANILLGFAGLIGIFVVRQAGDRIYSQDLVPLKPLFLLTSDFSTVRAQMRGLLTSNQGQALSTTDLDGMLIDMNQQLDEYGKSVRTPDQRKNYDRLKKDVSDYTAMKAKFVDYIKKGMTWQAQALLNDQIDNDLLSTSQSTFVLSTTEAQRSSTDNRIIFWCVFAAIVGFIAASVLFVLRSCRRVAGSISRPVEKMAGIADSIAQGDLGSSGELAGIAEAGDEMGALARSFQKIIASLRLLDTDVNNLIGEAREGRLDTRADAAQLGGSYGALVRGVNEMLDTVKEPLDAASAFIGTLADGEQPADLPDTFRGYYAALSGNLGRVRDSIGVLTEEADKLAAAGREGRLDVRGDESRVKGVYARIVHGVNETFDAFKAPLDVAAIYIAKMARGDELEELRNPYQGYYGRIIDNLNAVRNSLSLLVGESQKLALAGKAGDLAARGDASLVKGSYAKIILGINEAFDAIASPIREAQEVLARMAVNDLSVRMSGNCEGMLLDLSKSVNAVLDTLTGLSLVFVRLSIGDFSMLEKYKADGKKSEADEIVPACIQTMQTLHDLIGETAALEKAAVSGDLSARGDEEKYEGGYGDLLGGVNNILEAIEAPIAEAAAVLEKLSRGDLTATMEGEYRGEYGRIKSSLNHAVESIAGALGQISVSAGQVSAGSRQVSDGSQNLSQGAVQQASAVEELTSTVAEVSSQIRSNAGDAASASSLAAAVKDEALRGTEQMGAMLNAIGEISSASENISKIIKVIDDIAFQTNILALNAAVEAARAGQYGKGFAVVAEEVRNLASKSANAARETTDLIESSLAKVEAGTKIANETARKLDDISRQSEQSAGLADSIAAALGKQSAAIVQIDKGLEQISNVVQTNSATAEQSAAASEELSGQAEELLRQVSLFHLQGAPAGRSGQPAAS